MEFTQIDTHLIYIILSVLGLEMVGPPSADNPLLYREFACQIKDYEFFFFYGEHWGNAILVVPLGVCQCIPQI